MRIRTVKPEFWKHEGLSLLPEPTHMLAAALLNLADDEGYFNANPTLIKAECFPLREPSVSIQDSLIQLAFEGYVQLGCTENGRRYGWIRNFSEHQRVNRPTPSKIKCLQIVWESSPTTHGLIIEDSLPERKGKERNMEQGREGMREGVTVDSGESPSPPESEQKKRSGKRKAETLLTEYLSTRKAEGKKPFDDDSAVMKYTTATNLPSDYLRLAWRAFKEDHTEGTRKDVKYKDWPAVFLKALKSDWYRLWRFDAGLQEFVLTTAGHQAMTVEKNSNREKA